MKVRAAIFAFLLFGVLPAFTQSRPSKQQPSPPSTLELNAEEIVLNCTILDSKGQLVDGLDKNNFRVVEGKIPQTIISLQHQDTPVSIGLLVDNSGSMRPKRASVASAATDLIKASNQVFPLLAVLLFGSIMATAQTPSIAGTWVLTRAESFFPTALVWRITERIRMGLSSSPAMVTTLYEIYRAERLKFSSGDKLN